jgi:hypothetical protein
MKKILMSMFLTFAAVIATTTTAHAGSCTAVLDGPSLKAGTDHNGTVYSLASSYATATGNRAKTYFYNLSTLSNTFASDPNRLLGANLMEDDWLNADDLVKTYYGTFTGITLTNVYLNSTKISGNIEDEGDNVSELYLRSVVSKSNLDGGTLTTRSFFDYQLCQE